MLPLFLQRLDLGTRSLLPFVTTLFAALIGVMVWPLPAIGPVSPPLVLIALYYWSIHRADLLGSGSVFVIGVLHDILQDFPLGLSAFLFVAAHHLIVRNRRFFAGHSFFVMWAGFMLTIVSVMLANWLLLGLLRGQAVPILPVLTQILLTTALFPLPCLLFMRLQRAALSQN